MKKYLVLLALVGCSSADGSGAAGAGGSGGSTSSSVSTSSSTTSTASTTTTTTSAASSSSGTGGSGGAPEMPDPIPVIRDDPPAPCAAVTPNNDHFEFLDDICKLKVYPSDLDRDLACPTLDPSATIALTGGGSVTYYPSTDPVVVDDTALVGIVPADLDLTVILIRRVGGVPHYRYLSNGSHDIAYQPWSTTKFLAAANAAATLRASSNYKVGLTGSVDGYALGDFVTSLVSYDDQPFSSNSLGRYFHDIGGRAKANDLMHGLWLGRPASETFGGNYGELEPPLGFDFTDGASSVSITPDQSAGPANHLSSFATAEALKRLVVHREEAAQRLPGIQWADIKTLFYGAENSAIKGPWGGMSRDTAIYLQSGHDMNYLEKRSHGKWRIFSKLGLGSSGEFLNVGYGCFPALDSQGAPFAGMGRELVIATHLPTGGATWSDRDRLLATAYRAILKRVIDGRL